MEEVSSSTFNEEVLQLFPPRVESDCLDAGLQQSSPTAKGSPMSKVPVLVGEVRSHYDFDFQENINLRSSCFLELYRVNYLPILRQNRQRLDGLNNSEESNYCSVNYFSHSLTDEIIRSDCNVNEVLRKMGSFFDRSTESDPTLYEMIRFQINKDLKVVESYTLRFSEGSREENLSSLTKEQSEESALQSLDYSKVINKEEECMWETDISLDNDALLVNLTVSSITVQTKESMQLLLTKLRQSPQICRELPLKTIQLLLESIAYFFDSSDIEKKLEVDSPLCATEEAASIDKLSLVFGIAGIIVSHRGDLSCVLLYLKWMERLCKKLNESKFFLRIPFATEIVRSLVFYSKPSYTNFASSTPLDCYHYLNKQLSLPISVSSGEGSIQCIAISPDGLFFSAILGSTLVIIDRENGNVLKKTELHPKNMKHTWCLFFSSSSRYVIVTSKDGLKHVVYSTKELQLELEKHDKLGIPAVSIDYIEESHELLSASAPFLPSGRKSALHFFKQFGGIKKRFDCPHNLHRISFAAFVSVDANFTLVAMEGSGSGPLMLSANVINQMLVLSAFGKTCQAPLTSTSKWIKLHVLWIEGRWSAFQNGANLPLHGTTYAAISSFTLQGCTVLDGKGHASSVALWSSRDDSEEQRAVNRFFQRQSSLGVSIPLLYYPLDEGMGRWIKDLSDQSCTTIVSQSIDWDTTWNSAVTPDAYPLISMQSEDFLSSKILVSNFCIYILPPVQSLPDSEYCIVTEVDRKENTIQRQYRSLSSCVGILYALRSDETEIVVCEERFLTFRSINLLSQKALYHKITAANSQKEKKIASQTYKSSPEWMQDEISKKLIIHATEVAEMKYSSWNADEAKLILNGLNEISADTNIFRVMALLNLASAYFKCVLSGQLRKISVKPIDCNESLNRILIAYSDNQEVRKLAQDCLQLSLHCFYNMHQKSQIFFSVAKEKNWDLFLILFTEGTLVDMLLYLCTHDCLSQLPAFTIDLLKEFESVVDATSGTIEWITFYTISLVFVLQKNQKNDILLEITSAICDYLLQTIPTWSEESFNYHSKSKSVWTTAIFPFFAALSSVPTLFFTPKIENSLYTIIRYLRKCAVSSQEVISFDITSIHEVFPVSPLSNLREEWCFSEDFSRAKSVVILKEEQALSFAVLSQKKKLLDSEFQVIEKKSMTTKGDTILFMGVGKTTITAIRHYEISLLKSIGGSILECVEKLLLSIAQGYFFSLPRSNNLTVPLAFRYGLTTATLKKHGIHIPQRERISRYSLEVLEGINSGKDLVDSVCHRMRGTILPSMKPAIQSLLSILIHCGATEREAEKELRLTWFSGDWGINFQGPQREPALQQLREIATWVVHNVHFELTSSASLNRSASLYSQTVSFDAATIAQRSVFKDLLAAVRSALTMGSSMGGTPMERVMAQQTRKALNFCRGSEILRQLLLDADGSSISVSESLNILIKYTEKSKEMHFVESVFGAGLELEFQVRSSFHFLVKALSKTLLKDFSSFPLTTLEYLGSAMPNGSNILRLLSLYVYLWEEEDYAQIVSEEGTPQSKSLANTPVIAEEEWISLTKCLHRLLQIPFRNLRASFQSSNKNDISFVEKQSVNDLSEEEYQSLYRECFAALNIKSLGVFTSNQFSVCIPQLTIKPVDGAFQVRKTTEYTVFLRADEHWKTVLDTQNYYIEYFEVQVLTGVSGRLHIGLTSGSSNPQDASDNFLFSLSTDGQMFPPIQTDDQSIAILSGDTLGCGFDNATRKVFFTRNGVFWRCTGIIDINEKCIFPSFLFSENATIEMIVNFGGRTFIFDHTKIHPALRGNDGPSWFHVFVGAELALFSVTSRVCSIPDVKEDEDAMFFSKLCCDVACKQINTAADAISCSSSNSVTNYSTLCKAILFRTAENAILIQISTLKHFFCMEKAVSTEMQAIWRNIYFTMHLVIQIPLHSTLLASLRLLQKTIKKIGNLSPGDCSALVKQLFILAEKDDQRNAEIPFKATWDICDPQNISTISDTYAITLPKAKVSVVTGNVLPRNGEFSFSVTVRKQGSPKGRSLQSGYYVGVAKRDTYPSDVLQSWKARRPPVVWALHDVSPQLPYAMNPFVTPNAFMRAFGSDENIKVTVDREAKTVSFSREGTFLSQLFVNVPSEIDLVPFVQLYNEDAVVSLHAGTMTAPITESSLLSSVAVNVLQCMLRVPLFDIIVAKYLAKEMNQKKHSKVTFAVLNAVPDPRELTLCTKFEEDVPVNILDVAEGTYYYVRNNKLSSAHSYQFSFPRKATIYCRFVFQPEDSLSGMSLCIDGLVKTLLRHSSSILGINAFMIEEMNARERIIDEESNFFDILNESVRGGLFAAIRLLSLDGQFPTTVEYDYVFSSSLSNPHVQVLPQYLGKLIRLKNVSPTLSSFISIGDPAIPDKGIVNLRCRIRRNDDTHPLGGGYYFGVCTENFNWKSIDFARNDDSPPQVWALHDADSSVWRLKHMNCDVHFADNVSFRSGDTVRLEINRDSGTMHAFRKPFMGDETFLGLIFSRIPNEPLRPFVCLYNNDASAVLLPSSSDRVPIRVTKQKIQYACYDYTQKVYCSSCSMNQAEEVQLSQKDWYKCNECTNYALCSDCFYSCIHSHHVFSYMHSKKTTTYCSSPPWKLAVGMPVFIPSGPIFYLKSHACCLPQENISCVAVSSEENAYACWGLVGKPGVFSIEVHFNSDSNSDSNTSHQQQELPLFVGLTTNREVLSLNSNDFRSFVINKCSVSQDSDTIVVCSDPFFDVRGSSSSFAGLHDGCNIQFSLDWKNKAVKVSKNAIFHRSAAFPLSQDAEEVKNTYLLCFAFFSGKGQSSMVFPEQNRGIGAVVTEIKGSIIKVKIPHSKSRTVSKDQCRIPLVPLIYQQEILEYCKRKGSGKNKPLGYIVHDDKLTECTLLSSTSENEVSICIGGNTKRTQQISAANILVDPYKVPKTPQRRLNSSTGLGPTVIKGTSILKLLIILSSMCQSPVLSKIISQYKNQILPVLLGLSSHLPYASTSIDVIQSIRESLQSPSLWFRVPKTNDFIQQIHAPASSDGESIPLLPVGTVVSLFSSSRKNSLFRIISYNSVENKLDLLPFITVNEEETVGDKADGFKDSSVVHAPPSDCIPVKMTTAKNTVWCQDLNGLPSSKRELVLRKANNANPFCLASIEGTWRGTISYKNSTFGLEMSLKKERTFSSSNAILQSRRGLKNYLVWYEYYRYERYVRICMLESGHLPEKMLATTTFRDLVQMIENHGLLGERAYIIKGNIDYSGMQFFGLYRNSDGTCGSTLARLLTRVSFVSESTDDIEVLPECASVVREQTICHENRTSLLSNALVLLCRHLYMTLCYQNPGSLKHFIDNIALFHRHPLGIEFVKKFAPEESLRLLQKVSSLIKSPEVNPLDTASLAKYLMVTLENPSFVSNCPPFFLWEILHAAVFAAHRCGPRLRPGVLDLLANFVSRYTSLPWSFNYVSLFSSLVSYANHKIEVQFRRPNVKDAITDGQRSAAFHHDISSIVNLFVLPTEWPHVDIMDNIPLPVLQCLLDVRYSIENQETIPLAAVNPDWWITERHSQLKCLFGELVDQNFLKVGKVVGQYAVPRKKVYFEVVLSKDEVGTYAIGWGTEQHRRAADTHVGTDSFSFAFIGTSVSFAGAHSRYEIPFAPFLGMKQGIVIGCLLDLSTGQAAWSRNGVVGRFLPIPPTHLARDPLFAFASMNGGSGMSLLLSADEFLYAPEEYHDISGKKCQPHVVYDPSLRSTLPTQPKNFYVQLSTFLSAKDISRTTREAPPPSVTDYPLISAISNPTHLQDYIHMISFIEHGVYALERFIDLDSEKLYGTLASSFLYFKPVLREFSRLRLINFNPLTSSISPKEIVLRVNQPSSNESTSQTTIEFISQTVFFQCYKQLGDLRDEQWSSTPLFKVQLHLSGSGHSPIDMGGPYRQAWSLISQEIMCHPRALNADTTFVKQSLFRFCNNSHRVSLVPDEGLNSPSFLNMYTFFGKLMGYAAKARLPMDIEISPFLWRFMVDDQLQIEDYYMYVDSVIKSSMEDQELFANGMAEEFIPGLKEKLEKFSDIFTSRNSSAEILQQKQKIAQDCLLHSMDAQLEAIKHGLWKVLTPRVLRCLYWKDLEELVCGVSNPSISDLKKYIKCNLTSTREAFFWEIVAEMNAEQKSSLLCFACGQRRLPLIRFISVVENSESEFHLPRAQSCSSLISIPQYQSLQRFKEKLLHALQHQNEMELA